ncbi:hypothetical protein [Rhizobium sp. BK661]|uniref:hypothetical protein n=1 Tax=Rhizobium sp. BK661 TaxID=2586991 RepID=UPI00216999ED|nr:hypothetical protein [Rhizobium sp. BK661]MCS3744332.1 hypothetical protein [Rhizobium sp. BK661]
MSMDQQNAEAPFLDDETWNYLVVTVPRVLRACGYALVATLLMSTISYEITGEWTLITVIGILGLFTSSARIGQFGILILLAMALISPDVVQTFLPR